MLYEEETVIFYGDFIWRRNCNILYGDFKAKVILLGTTSTNKQGKELEDALIESDQNFALIVFA